MDFPSLRGARDFMLLFMGKSPRLQHWQILRTFSGAFNAEVARKDKNPI